MTLLMDTTTHTHEKAPSSITFLVCVDGRTDSHIALRMACIKAQKRGGVVEILHVLEPAESESLFGASDKMRSEREAEAKAALLSLSAIAEGITGKKPTLLLKEGLVGETIVKVAVDTHANMLVLGVVQGSSRGKLVAWLATQLGVRLWTPMLLIPANLTDEQMLEIS
jgi:nucleotide-binding universal stress UspA family protein